MAHRRGKNARQFPLIDPKLFRQFIGWRVPDNNGIPTTVNFISGISQRATVLTIHAQIRFRFYVAGRRVKTASVVRSVAIARS
jgi:hypothetical protein